MARCATCHRRLVAGQACPAHGGSVAPTDRRHPPQPPEWTRPLGRCVGYGGFASVWEIEGGGVLKVAHVDHDQARARVAREAEALRAIGGPTVPRLDGHGVLDDGRGWIAMERIAGQNLADVTTEGAIRSDRAIAISLAILDALQRVHDAGFVHRDLKPDNIVLRDDRTAAILDLGLARKLPVDPDDPTRANVRVGSLEYIPPEQLIDASSVDARADLYAFGCVIYELCAGRPPFLGDGAALERAHAALRPPPLGALAAVPGELEVFVHECLSKLPARRPPSASALRALFSALRDTTPPSMRTQRAEHAWAVIREGTQPVVLLWTELPRVDRALLAVFAAHKLTVVSQRGRRVLAAATGLEHADPAGVAIATARELAAAGARIALHLDELRVTPDANGFSLSGPAIERPDAWLPAGNWTGVVLTRALATVTLVPARSSELGPGFSALGDPGEVPELFGRDGLVGDLAADAAAALAGLGPGLAVVIGEPGVGKSALAAALGPRLYEMGARVIRAAIPPPGSARPAHSALAEVIGDAIDDLEAGGWDAASERRTDSASERRAATRPGTASGVPIVRAIGDALRAAARKAPVAIIIDDLQFADAVLLDAIEYATLGGEPLPIWILGLAGTRLDLRRPGFGKRAERHRRDVLAPLDEEAAVNLIAALLRPAEYPPLRALRQIAAIARGNPLHLGALAREIHDRGAIRVRPNGEHFLDTTVLDELPPLALGPWLAARELAELGDELVGLARICAVLGDTFERDELAAVVDLVEQRGGATTSIDVDIGLDELASAGILAGAERPSTTTRPVQLRAATHTGSRGWAFRHALVQDGIYATTDAEQRHVLHRAALDFWLTRAHDDPAVAEPLARHAEVVGDDRIAAAAFATLGAHAHRLHRHMDADQAWQGALRHLAARDGERARALVGRARARYRIQRVRDALTDLDEAIMIAVALGDPALEIDALLERATALDWNQEYARSQQTSELAVKRLHTASIEPTSTLTDALDLGRGRAAFREERLSEAADILRSVMASQDLEVKTIAGLMLGPVLVDLGAPDAAESVFEEVITICHTTGDRFHLGAAYLNRAWLWSTRGDIERVVTDLRMVIELGREAGHAWLERAATHNLAENRLWQGDLDEALRLTRRSLALAESYGEADTNTDRLLLARIFAARDDEAMVLSTIATITIAELPDHEQRMLAILGALSDGRTPWEHALDRIESIPAPYRLEMARLASARDKLTAQRLHEVLTLAKRDPIWSRRIGEFAQPSGE